MHCSSDGSQNLFVKLMVLCTSVVLLARAYCLVMQTAPLFAIFLRTKELAKHK